MKLPQLVFLISVSLFVHADELRAEDFRLPTTIVPISYEIQLEPDFTTDTFRGVVIIQFRTAAITNSITLHANELNITESSIYVFDEDAEEIGVVATAYSNDDRHFYTIYLESILAANSTYGLYITEFTGILNGDDEGFYLARYTDENRNVRKLVTTQFQPTGARRAFPCFDEPALKAYFQVTLIRPAEYISLTNTDILFTVELSENLFADSFERTSQIMSTYLVAFVVCDFTYIASGDHRVYARSEYINQGRGAYALSMSRPMLDGIAGYVDYPYTWGKIDQIGIPDEYFWLGAMENWGLVTYRESLLLYATGISSSFNKQNIIRLIAHEYVHMWFGNLVTPSWWTYLWLNEGFATYLEYYGPNLVEPDMEMITQFPIRIVQNALRQDSAINARIMRTEVNTPSEIRSLFDYVIYAKSGSIIKMMEDVLSTEVFRLGLNDYLTKLAYGVTVSHNLYDSWEYGINVTGINNIPDGESIASIMLSWELNAGYPLITVTRDYATGNVTLSQRRFIDSNPNNQDESIWKIPITYSTTTRHNFSDVTTDLWLMEREQSLTLPYLYTIDWLLLNNRQSGYYRINYDTTNWYRIISYLSSTAFQNIDRINRAQLIDDAFALSRFGVLSYNISLDLSTYLRNETDFIPLFPFYNVLSFLDPYLQNSGAYTAYTSYLFDILDFVYNLVGLTESESDGHLFKLNRQSTLQWICRYGDLSCRFHSLERIRAWRDNNDVVPPNLQTVYSCSALRVGTQSDFDFLYEKYVAEELLIRERLLPALGCSENGQVLENYLNIILTENSTILENDRFAALAGIYNAGTFGLNYFFNFLQGNYGRFQERFTDAQFSSIVSGMASRFTTSSQLANLQNFASIVADSAAFANAISIVQSNIVWAEENVPSITAWLSLRNYLK